MAFVPLRVHLVQMRGDEAIEDRVTEEFEALVGKQRRGIVRRDRGFVGKGQQQKLQPNGIGTR